MKTQIVVVRVYDLEGIEFDSSLMEVTEDKPNLKVEPTSRAAGLYTCEGVLHVGVAFDPQE
jgi:hypothetical protein